MQEIRDPERLENVWRGQSVHFRSRPPVIRLLRFEKGELLNHPLKPLNQFLIVVEGSVTIYNIPDDGCIRYVAIADRDTLLGDMEFSGAKGGISYTEAAQTVLCLAIPFQPNQSILEQDPIFLRFLLQQLARKLTLSFTLGVSSQPLEERLLHYLREERTDHALSSIHDAMLRLHCSRRQLQRVVQKLCQEGSLKKVGRGKYRLSSDSSAIGERGI